MFVDRDELAEHVRGEFAADEQGVRRVVAAKRARRDLGRRDALGTHLLRGLAKGERLGLREEVRHEQVVVDAEVVVRPAEADEVAGDELRPLVDQLVVGVLSVGARLAPDDRAGLVAGDGPALAVHRLAVALHVELLQVGREALQVLAVGQDRHRLGAEEVVVPEPEEPEEHRDVRLERGGAKVLVHEPEAREHLREGRGSDRDHEG